MPRTVRRRKRNVNKSQQQCETNELTFISLLEGMESTRVVQQSIARMSLKLASISEHSVESDLRSFKDNFLDQIEEIKNAWKIKKTSFSKISLGKKLKDFKTYRDMQNQMNSENLNQANEVSNELPPSSDSQEELRSEPGCSSSSGTGQSTKKRTSRSVFTPLNSRNNDQNMKAQKTITPKVDINQPLSMIRYGKIGEHLFSSEGSPVLASRPLNNVACVNVPIDDGHILSILPSQFNRKELPNIDKKTKKDLKKLFENLAMIVEESSDDDD